MIYICDDRRHLVCWPYSVDNLHKMAADLQIKRCWYHAGKYPHYDIPARRELEIMARCQRAGPRVILAIIRGQADAQASLPLLGHTTA